MTFVWHKAAITNRHSVGDSGFSHMYLADDMSEAIITDNRRHLLYQKPLRGLTYQQMKEAFQNCFAGVHQDTYWDLAIPWWDGTLIGCYESYNLMHVATDDNELLDTVEYCSGMSRTGCNLNTILNRHLRCSPLMVMPSPWMSSPCAFSFRRSSMTCSSRNSI